MRLLRLVTGLVIASFVVGHFSNHALGVVSIEAMDRLRFVLASWWRSPVGTFLLYGSLLTHFVLALASLYRRSTLRMPLWEAAQLVLGLAIPPLLIGHIVGTRLTWTLLGHAIDYERVVGLLWSSEWSAIRQSLLLLIVWAHLCFGCTTGCGCARGTATCSRSPSRSRCSCPRSRSPASRAPGSTSGRASRTSAACRSTTSTSPA